MSEQHSRISTKEEIQLITEVKRHPSLYERDGHIKYGDDNYNASWDEVSKHLGIDVNVCRTKWTAIENYYKRKNCALNMGHSIDSSENLDKSFDTDNSQTLFGPSSITGVDRSHFVGRYNSKNELMCNETFDIESVSGEKCESKTAYVTLRDRILKDVKSEPKNDEINQQYNSAIKENYFNDILPKKSLQCMTTQKERCQSEDFICELGDKRNPPITVANQTHENEQDEIKNIAVNGIDINNQENILNSDKIQQKLLNNEKVFSENLDQNSKDKLTMDSYIPNDIIKKQFKEVKCGIIQRMEKYYDNDAEQTFLVVPVSSENSTNNNATGDSTEVIKCRDIGNKKISRVITKQQILFNGSSKQSNSNSVAKIDLSNVIFHKMECKPVENVTKKRRNIDSSHDEHNISNLSNFNKKVRLEEMSPLEDRNSRKLLMDKLNLYRSRNSQEPPLVDIQNNNSQSRNIFVDDIITSLVSKKIHESAQDITMPNATYVSNFADGRMTAISPPYIVLNHSDKEVSYEGSYLTKNINTSHTINAEKSTETYELNNNLNISNSFSTEGKSSNRMVDISHNALTNLNSRERLTILNVNTNQTDMNVFFDELAKYVSHTYPLEKQIDIRKKICDLVTTMEMKDPDHT